MISALVTITFCAATLLFYPDVVLAKKNSPQPSVQTESKASTQELKTQRQKLRSRLKKLKKEIAKSESHRNETVEALAQTERAISKLNHQLHQLNAQQHQTSLQLEQLHSQQQHTLALQQLQRYQLAQVLRYRYMNPVPESIQLFLKGDNPHQIQRNLHYLSYITDAQTRALNDLQQTNTHLNILEQEIQGKQTELSKLQQEQEVQRKQLLKETTQRRQILKQISSKIKAQRHEAYTLQRDEKRLANLVKQIARKLAHQKAQRSASSKRSHLKNGKTQTDNVVTHNNVLPDSDLEGNFEKLKGRLHLPVRGDVISRFGATRAGGGPSWKGLFIQAIHGLEVHAIASGRVVFSEWLRGFGNLLIIDHGSQYLSIYGNNEALLKGTGDLVKAGETIARIGNSGGNSETGLYFELRHKGQPFDPMLWVTVK